MATIEVDAAAAGVAIHFIRHGEVFNPGSIFYGRLPGFHLSETGFREARELGADMAQSLPEVATKQGLRGTSAVLYSPMLRARETAEVLVASHTAHTDLAQCLEVEDDLIEVRTPYENKPLKEIVAMKFELYSHGREDEGFETFPDVVRRVRRLVEKLFRSPRHRGTQVLAVCHGDICLAARLLALKGVRALVAAGPKKNQPSWLTYPDHCSVTTLWVGAEDELDQPRWLNIPASISVPDELDPKCKRQKVANQVGSVEIASNA